jgi:hypothetical protein
VKTERKSASSAHKLDGLGKLMVTMVTMGGDLQPGSLADRPLTGLGQPQINKPLAQKEKEKVYCSAEKGNHEQVGC